MSQRWGLLRRRLSWVGLAAAVAVAAASAYVADASEGPAVPLVGSLPPLVFQDGDHVAFGDRPAGDGAHGDERHHADAKAGAGSGGATYHDGFSTYGDALLGERYEIRLVDSHRVEELRPHVTESVAAASAASGVPLTVLPGTVAPTGPREGQIDIVVSSRSPCGGLWLGCGGPNIDGGRIESGVVWINPRLFERPVHEMSNTVRHELGHTLGLAHYEYLHEDRVQTMHPTLFEASRYESGDVAGLHFVGGGRAAPASPALPPSDPEGSLDAAVGGPFGIVVHGWAIDRDAGGPITVTITIGGRAVDVRADGPRTMPDGSTEVGAFRVARVAGPGVHQVCATARNAGGGADAPLGCVAVRVRVPSVGFLGLQTF